MMLLHWALLVTNAIVKDRYVTECMFRSSYCVEMYSRTAANLFQSTMQLLNVQSALNKHIKRTAKLHNSVQQAKGTRYIYFHFFKTRGWSMLMCLSLCSFHACMFTVVIRKGVTPVTVLMINAFCIMAATGLTHMLSILVHSLNHVIQLICLFSDFS